MKKKWREHVGRLEETGTKSISFLNSHDRLTKIEDKLCFNRANS